MVQISLQNSGGKVVFYAWVPRNSPWALTGVKVPWSLKGVLHPRPVFRLFLQFSQKLQHIGNK